MRPQSQRRRLCSAGLGRAAQPLPAVAAAEGGEAKDSLFHVLVSQVPRGPDGSSQARSCIFEKVLLSILLHYIYSLFLNLFCIDKTERATFETNASHNFRSALIKGFTFRQPQPPVYFHTGGDTGIKDQEEVGNF